MSTTNVIAKFEGDNAFLSNFWSGHSIDMDYCEQGLKAFSTAEAAFQAAKATCMPLGAAHKAIYLNAVQQAKTPSEAKYLGRSVKVDLDKWDLERVHWMRQVIFKKFQEPGLKALLLGTGHAMLVEGNTWGDTFWGRCEGKGSNILGALLMELRGHLYWLDYRHRMANSGQMQ